MIGLLHKQLHKSKNIVEIKKSEVPKEIKDIVDIADNVINRNDKIVEAKKRFFA